ncbi:hypothetical protein HHK36_002112 [Tetracentron sinense]|uniref:Uncharacterized protein n=1 Tax=Tetracentron sinense TaxID=13715 RepID=A0A834ZZ96_TETSI|nr:hypothetical protein HHK36_002112 [Tetracentron sinense]
MTTLQSSSLACSSASRGIRATLQAPKLRHLSMPKLPRRDLGEELNMRRGYTTTTQIEMKPQTATTTSTRVAHGGAAQGVVELLGATGSLLGGSKRQRGHLDLSRASGRR